MPKIVKVLDLETGQTLERTAVSAREIIATGRGRYCDPANSPAKQARAAQEEPGAEAPDPHPASSKTAAMLAANAKRRAEKAAASLAKTDEE